MFPHVLLALKPQQFGSMAMCILLTIFVSLGLYVKIMLSKESRAAKNPPCKTHRMANCPQCAALNAQNPHACKWGDTRRGKTNVV